MLPKRKIQSVFEMLSHSWPDAECELFYKTPFQLLLAVVLSAQATDKSVNKVMKPFLESCPDFSPRDLVNMGEKGFFNLIKTIGLAPTKSKNCFLLSKALIEKYDSKVPRQREGLEALSGVGRKTASVVLNVLYGEATVAVDTHVARLSNRLGLLKKETDNRDMIEKELHRVIPKKFIVRAHHLLIFHGRYHCVARKPKCTSCFLKSVCPKNLVETYK